MNGTFWGLVVMNKCDGFIVVRVPPGVRVGWTMVHLAVVPIYTGRSIDFRYPAADESLLMRMYRSTLLGASCADGLTPAQSRVGVVHLLSFDLSVVTCVGLLSNAVASCTGGPPDLRVPSIPLRVDECWARSLGRHFCRVLDAHHSSAPLLSNTRPRQIVI